MNIKEIVEEILEQEKLELKNNFKGEMAMKFKVQGSMLKLKYSLIAFNGDDPNQTKDDRKSFNRKEKYEVIKMIQKVVDHFNFTDKRKVQEIESVIRNELPGFKSQWKVFKWLVDYFRRKINEPFKSLLK